MQDSDNNESNESEIPNHVLDTIGEFSPEGFILFTVNSHGEVSIYKAASCDVIESGLISKSLKVLNTLSMMEENDIASDIFRQKGGVPPDEQEE